MKDSTLNILMSAASARINARIDDQADVAQQFFRNWNVKKEDIDERALVVQTLKRKGYSNYGDLFTKGFVCFEIEGSIDKIKAWIDIPGLSTRHQEITESFITGVIVAANYYEKL